MIKTNEVLRAIKTFVHVFKHTYMQKNY